MCIVFTCGEKEFSSQLQGYEGVTCQCHNCGNWSAHVVKRHPWFTFCFVPVIPLSIHGYQDVICNICHFVQALENRPDIQPGQGGNQIPLQNQNHGQGGPPPGWNQGQGPAPGKKTNQNMHYG